MNRWISGALLLGGLILFAAGLSAAGSVTSETSEVLTGAPTNKAIWLMVGGAVLGVVGLVGMIRKPAGTLGH